MFVWKPIERSQISEISDFFSIHFRGRNVLANMEHRRVCYINICWFLW